MVDRYVIYFSILSVVGYVYECFAMTIWEGKWDNRGFLFGPAIPIYGAGALMGTILFTYFIKDYTPLSVFLIGMVASAILEYSVHYVLEQIFHAYWWDYSKTPLNLNGRICLPASIGFGIAALIIIYVINPALLPILEGMNENLCQFLAILLTFLFTLDFTLTVTVLSGFEDRVESMDSFINEHMDSFIGNILDEEKGLDKKFYGAVDRIEDLRKRLISSRIEKVVTSMSHLYKRAVSRIKRFTGRNSGRMNDMLGAIKRRIKKEEENER